MLLLFLVRLQGKFEMLITFGSERVNQCWIFSVYHPPILKNTCTILYTHINLIPHTVTPTLDVRVLQVLGIAHLFANEWKAQQVEV